MAKQIGIKITGRIDEYSFYHNCRHGYLVRRTSGVTSEQYHSDDRYAAARAASQEFASVSKAGKLIRTALAEFIAPLKDGTMVNRLNKELIALKQLDNKHDRGKRKPETRIADSDANKWLRIFQFNDNAKLYDLYKCGMLPRAQNAVLQVFPENATHAGLTGIKTSINFENGTFKTSASPMTIVSNSNKDEIEYAEFCSRSIQDPGSAQMSGGIEITCLQVLFFREENGKLVQLKEKVHSMGIIGVRKIETDSSSGRRLKLKRNKKTKFFKQALSWRKSITSAGNPLIIEPLIIHNSQFLLPLPFNSILAKHNSIPLRLAPFNLFPCRYLLPWKPGEAQSLGVDALGTYKGNVFAGIP